MYKKDIYQRVGDGDHKVTKDKISNWSKAILEFPPKGKAFFFSISLLA